MSHAQRLRALADRTGLDGFGDELRAMADEMEESQTGPDLAICPACYTAFNPNSDCMAALRTADGVPPPLTSEQIKPLAAGSAFESEAFAQRIAAARDAQWLALRTAAQPAVDHDVLHDSAWIAGAKFGWNCGVTGDSQQLNDSINARIKQRVDAKANAPQHQPAAQPVLPADHEQAMLRVIDERERCHEWADQLADAIAKHTGRDIGEHSSANNPWRMALNALEAHERLSAAHAAQPVGETVTLVLETMERVKTANPGDAFFTLQVLSDLADKLRVTTPQPVAVPDGKPLGYLPQWAVDRLTGEMGAVADPVTWGLHAPIMSGDCPHHVAIYKAPQPTPLPEHADHVPDIAARPRLVAQLAGCPDAVPQDDEIAVGAIFSVLGNMRFKLERLPSRLQPAAVLDALAIFERLTGRDDDPVEARQAYDTLRLALVKQEGGQL